MKFIYIIFFLTLTTLSNMVSADDSNTNHSKENKLDHLTDIQKHVTQHDGTEPAFNNEYWNHKEEGIYVDIMSGKPLFSSTDKYDSGTGWPSFTKSIEENNINKKSDNSLGMSRVEVRSKTSDSHLGHVFSDGPKEAGGSRYCINSAALKFIPKNKMVEQGYEEYMYLFDDGLYPSSSLPSSKIDDGKEKNDYSFQNNNYDIAILSGGCFWGVEELIRKLDGVVDVVVGYIGGNVENPTYKLISTGLTGHAEAVKITFDKSKLSYGELLKFFFRIHDPTTLNRQGNDIGTQYRSTIFYLNDEQKKIAEDIKAKADQSGVFDKKIVTKIEKATKFYLAEDSHQDYLQKIPGGYTCHYIREEWKF